MCDVCWNLRLGHHEVENLNPVLAQPDDAGPHVGQHLLDDGQEECVVHLVNCVVGTEDPGQNVLEKCSDQASQHT